MTVQSYIDQSSLLGGITDGCQAISMLNAARELLWPLDDWTGTVTYGCVRLNEGCFFLPFDIESVRKAWKCGQNIPINNENWLYVEQGMLSDFCDGEVSIVRTDKSVVIPVHFPTDDQIGFRPSDAGDEGKEIAVTIRNVFGSVSNEAIKLGSIRETVYAELAVRELISINKRPTEGAIQVYSKNDCDVETRRYVIEAYETDVRYWQYQSLNSCECVVIKGKRKFFPYKETDLYREVDIKSMSALQFASQAIEHMRNKNYKEYQNALLIARTHLERTKEDIKRTSAPGVPANYDVAIPTSNATYGYQ